MNKKLTVLGALLMAVAVTGYSVSGTYAKYVSSVDMGTQTAKVAKFKVEKKTGYTGGVTLFDTKAWDGTDNTGAVVLKPGAVYSQDLDMDFVEVDSEVATITTYEIAGSDTVVNGTYAPMKYALVEKVNGNETDVTTWLTFEELQNLVAGTPETSEGAGDAVAAFNFESGKTYTLWAKWDQTESESYDVDEQDTLLGEAMADGADYGVEITLTATVTQDVSKN